MHLGTAIFLSCLLSMNALCAEAPSEAEKLIEQLGAEHFDTREAAMQKLHELGGKAYLALLAARKHGEPEVRMRVESLLPLAELLYTYEERVAQYKDALKTQEAMLAKGKTSLERLQETQQAFAANSADYIAYRSAYPDLFLPAFGAKMPGHAVVQLTYHQKPVPEPPPPLDPEEVESLRYTNIKPGQKRLKRLSYSKDAQSDSDATLRWLASAQDQNGSWNSRLHGAELQGDIPQTALALVAYLSCGHTERVGQYRDNVRRAIKWLVSQQRENGAFCDANGTREDMSSHAFAAWALTCASTMGNVPETKTAAKQARCYAEDVLEQWFSKQREPTSDACPKVSLPAVWLLTLSFRSALRHPAEETPKFQKLLPRIEAWLSSLEDSKTGQFKWSQNGESSPYATVFAFNVHLWLRADLAPQTQNEKEIEGDLVHKRRSTAFKEAVKRCGGFAYGTGCTDVVLNFALMQNAFHTGGEIWKEQHTAMKIQLEAGVGRDGQKSGSYSACGLWTGAGTVHATSWNLLACTIYYRYLPFR
ncbi:MAG: hypothetical protein KIS92_05815 [Planctomycetota bacterium]|nr:hypothetical protein [Planctomycetota bacterium]